MKELKIFDNPGNVKKFLRFFYASLVLLLIADFFVHKHAEFPWEGIPEFYALFGFVSCVFLNFFVKFVRFLIKRDEEYYEK